MALCSIVAEHESELRADLQRYYGINLDNAMGGEHSAAHIAALVQFMPHDSSVSKAYDDDAVWTVDRVLMATLINSLHLLMWGMSDKAKRGAKPEPVGPSWMRTRTRTLDAQVMPISELLEKLSLERR